jgi:hypothetical protein
MGFGLESVGLKGALTLVAGLNLYLFQRPFELAETVAAEGQSSHRDENDP